MTKPPEPLVADPGSIAVLQQEIAAGRSDPCRLLEQCLARIAATEPLVQVWCHLDPDGARAQAERLRDEAAAGRLRGPLHGIPVAIKDVIDVAGWQTRANSPTRANVAPSTIDANVVTLLRTAGAIILGKAHTTEFAYFEKEPPTRNPHNLNHTPGGSSAGPAAAVAAGIVPLSLGTQTAGSVNRPAAYCGIGAFKPSTRSWSRSGVVPFSVTFDTVGVFGYRVADATAAARVLMPPFLRPDRASTKSDSLVIGCIDEPVLGMASAAVTDSIRSATAKLAAAGIRVQQRTAPVAFADIAGWHKTIIEYELARAQPQLALAPPNDVSTGVRRAIERGQAIDHQTYDQALRAVDDARERFWPAMADLDALIFPTAPDIAPAGMKTGDPRFITPFTALAGPIVSVPVGFGAEHLPLGLMILSAPGTDGMLADIADRLATIIEVPR